MIGARWYFAVFAFGLLCGRDWPDRTTYWVGCAALTVAVVLSALNLARIRREIRARRALR